MGWETLLARPDEAVTVPWTGGRALRANGRQWKIEGRLPPEHGWHEFAVTGGRRATWKGPAEVDAGTFFERARLVQGYLVGDRILVDGAPYVPDPSKIIDQSQQVHFVELGLDRFTRASVARFEGVLIFVRPEFPLGPEPLVQAAFQDRVESLAGIAGVTPALDLAYRFESWQRLQVEERRRVLEEQRRQEAERLAAEERRRALVERLGDGASRREMARIDFGEAARAALAVAGAELLDWRPSHNRGEFVVQFRHINRRFECVCDTNLHIIDSGVCLVGNDRLFTLESLPGVIAEADDTGRLHVFRHVDGEEPEEDRW